MSCAPRIDVLGCDLRAFTCDLGVDEGDGAGEGGGGEGGGLLSVGGFVLGCSGWWVVGSSLRRFQVFGEDTEAQEFDEIFSLSSPDTECRGDQTQVHDPTSRPGGILTLFSTAEVVKGHPSYILYPRYFRELHNMQGTRSKIRIMSRFWLRKRREFWLCKHKGRS